MKTQNERLIEYLHKFGSITQQEALSDLGIFRLASRISELKRMGVRFGSEMVSVNNRFGEKIRVKKYFLTDSD